MASTAAVLTAAACAAVLLPADEDPLVHATGPSAPVEHTVQQRPFRSVVTLDAEIRAQQPVLVHQGATDKAEWSVNDGDRVTKGQLLGTLTTSTGELTLEDLRISLADARQERADQARLLELDVRQAEQSLARATGEAKDSARGELARVRLTSRQALEKLDLQISRLNTKVSAARNKMRTLTAPVAGKVVRDEGGVHIQPDGFEATAAVPPVLMYRLDAPEATRTSAVVRVTGGPAEFDCGAIAYRGARPGELTEATATRASAETGSPSGTREKTAPDDAAPRDTSMGEDDRPGISASCTIPRNVRVYAGLTGTLAITVVDLPKAIVLDASAIRLTTGEKGLVSVRTPDGSIEDRTVSLGATDGLVYVVAKGLRPGETALARTGEQR
ncbi:hypothetical protein [Streptomyces sp. NPDC005805]|uniref:hypothetical protein n=1 Tax=Streptomyces sp. NPDC005805 TaxID=3157068 RepID=UPI0033D1EE29